MTALFPPAFVISLPGETARREKIRRDFTQLQIPFVFFDAIDGRQLDVHTHPAYDGPRRRRAAGKDLMGGEIGCLLSHKAVLQKVIASNYPSALIFEDDVVLNPDFKNVVAALAGQGTSFDIVRFLGSPKVAKGRHRKIAPLYRDYHLVRLARTHGGAHAYLITKQGAEKLLGHMKKNAFPIDILLCRTWETGLETLSVQPGLATQDLSFKSSIGTEREKKQKAPVLTRALFKAGEAIGKRWSYWSAVPRDTLLKARFSGNS